MSAKKSLMLVLVAFCVIGLSVGQAVDTTTTSANDQQDDSNVTARTFGHHFLKRISFAMLPAAFVVGVITTLLAALTIVSMKGLGVGVILLVIALGQMLGRFLPAAAVPAAQFQTAPYPLIYGRQEAAASWRR